MTTLSSTAEQGAVTLMDYTFPKGYTLETTVELWADKDSKSATLDPIKEDKEATEAARKPHEAKVKFDLGECKLRELIQKLITTANSPRVAWQNATRPTFDGSEDNLVKAFAVNNHFTFKVKDWVENARQKMTDEEKTERTATKNFDKMTPAAQQKWIDEKTAELKAKAESAK